MSLSTRPGLVEGQAMTWVSRATFFSRSDSGTPAGFMSAEPLMPVGWPAQRVPGALVLLAPHRPEGGPGNPAARRDLVGLPIGSVRQHEPETGIVRMERDQPSNAVGVIIGMRNDHPQAAAHPLAPPLNTTKPVPGRISPGPGDWLRGQWPTSPSSVGPRLGRLVLPGAGTRT
jgi:hypothetical protein